MEPVFCHGAQTLRLVRVVRLLDEALRRSMGRERERLLDAVREFEELGRRIAREELRS